MTLLEGIALGALQGATEFLPVSSSGHLVVMQAVFGLRSVPLLFDVILHLATLGATIVVFRRRIASIFAALFRWALRRGRAEDRTDLRLAVAVIVGTFATGILGLLIDKFIPTGNLKFVSGCFLVTALILVASERLAAVQARRTSSGGVGPADAEANEPAVPGGESAGTRSPGVREGILVGLAQGIGVVPGISRSGITISASLASGVDRSEAGEFSFLLSIPAILGAFILQLKDADTLLSNVDLGSIAAGFVAAFVVGFVALKFLLAVVRKGRLSWFAVYLVPIGIAGLLFL